MQQNDVITNMHCKMCIYVCLCGREGWEGKLFIYSFFFLGGGGRAGEICFSRERSKCLQTIRMTSEYIVFNLKQRNETNLRNQALPEGLPPAN